MGACSAEGDDMAETDIFLFCFEEKVSKQKSNLSRDLFSFSFRKIKRGLHKISSLHVCTGLIRAFLAPVFLPYRAIASPLEMLRGKPKNKAATA